MIPARMGSSRFPGKPLAPLLGRTMIEHVFKRTRLSTSLDEVYIATCDKKIFQAVENFGGKAVMTADTHERASDRIAEAIEGIEADIVVMVQGDEPMVVPEMIDEAVTPMSADRDIQCINLTKRIEREEDFRDPNTIKVVTAQNGDALFMSRQPIPAMTKESFSPDCAHKQVCIIPFRRDALLKFTALEPTPLEIAESVDMMRFLEHGVPVRMVKTRYDSQAVDTAEDLARVEALMQNDPLLSQY